MSTAGRGDGRVCVPAGVEQASPTDRLRRWEQSGAQWRVMSRTSSRLVVAMLTCDGGEEVDRLVSDDAELRAFVGSRPGSGL